MALGLANPLDLVGNGAEPRPAIVIGERMPRAHLGDIAFGVKFIAVLESPSQTISEGGGDRALARTRDAHHDQGAGRFVRSVVQASPRQPRPGPPARPSHRSRAPGWPAGFRPSD